MKNININDSQNIEHLQQKIADYKKTLNALKNNDSTEELNHLKQKVDHTEQLIKTMNERQEIEFKKYEQEVSMLSEQLNTLNQTVYEITKKLSNFTNNNVNSKPEPTTPKSTTVKSSTLENIPSFRQLQRLHAQHRPIENPPSEPDRGKPVNFSEKHFQNNQFPTSLPIRTSKTQLQSSVHRFNTPSANNKFSVTLNSRNIVPPIMETAPPPKIEEHTTVEQLVKEENHFENEAKTIPQPLKNKETSSLLNFFRKR